VFLAGKLCWSCTCKYGVYLHELLASTWGWCHQGNATEGLCSEPLCIVRKQSHTLCLRHGFLMVAKKLEGLINVNICFFAFLIGLLFVLCVLRY